MATADIRAPKQPTPPVVVHGRKFDRIVTFDERSREYPIRRLVPKRPRSYTWAVGTNWLDQKAEGACVGFAWAHELQAKPSVVARVTDDFARTRIYFPAQERDQWPGGAYPGASPFYEGTSVIAGAQIVQKDLGGFVEYRWAFGLDDLRLAVGHAGPAVLGINWYEGMFEADEKGFVHVTGQIAGGHAIVCYGVSQSGRYFKLRNSWGRGWGKEGDCFVSFGDMARLLAESGEACIPVGRKRIMIQ